MKVRSILSAHKAVLLGGVLLMPMLPAPSAIAADADLPVKAAPAADDSIWYSHGVIDAGGNIFIEKPPSGFGRIPTDPFWLTPKTTDSNAKMDEYGKVPRGLFLDVFGLNAGTKDGRFAVDFWADNVGYNNQHYDLSVYEPGRQYFNIGWDQTPHLLSTSAKSIFGGVGSTSLTVDPTLRQNLENNVRNATAATPAGQTARNNIEGFVNNAETNIDLKTLRERFNVGYRNTMWDDWDFIVDYSHEHRTGTRPLGIGWGLGALNTTPPSFGANPRPSTGSVEVPQPLDDRTQNANAYGEYVGTTPWGTRWNTQLKYSGSFYSNDNKSIDVDNPFCLHCSAIAPTVLGSPPAGTAQFGPSLFRYGLYPDNNVNGVTWNTAVEFPIFKTRYVSNVQYMAFRQDDPFINDATNGLTFGTGGNLTITGPFPSASQLRPYPASSLNGEVNAFLTNNVLYSHLTSDLTNTARVRYYDRQDNTPTLTFLNYALADGGLSTATPLTRLPTSYTKLNIEDELKWQPTRAWAFGTGYFFERYTYQNGEVDATNESGVKAFVNLTPWTWLTGRLSMQYAQRRYDHWLLTNATDPAANAMRQFFVQNRDQTKANGIIDLQVTKDITISPNGGVRWIEYPTDLAWTAAPVPQPTNTLGTQYDRGWNVGTDLVIRLSPELRATFGYNYEERTLYMQSCCGGSPTSVPFNDQDKWSSQIAQRYNTFVASALWNAIPGKVDILADYVIALATEANNSIGCAANINSCTGKNVATDPPVVWPTEKNNFQRFNVVAKYYVDPSVVKQMGFVGNVTLKLRYTWEHNNSDNWAINNFTPYSPSTADAGGVDITNGGRSLFLAYNNPNYTAQIIALGLNMKW
jgi:MtrB/PioB family decaheme-associated outer membrane protein